MDNTTKTYFWEWDNCKVNIRTHRGQQAAVELAKSYFPNNENAHQYITTTDPIIIDESAPTTNPETNS